MNNNAYMFIQTKLNKKNLNDPFKVVQTKVLIVF